MLRDFLYTNVLLELTHVEHWMNVSCLKKLKFVSSWANVFYDFEWVIVLGSQLQILMQTKCMVFEWLQS
jgi:hypothetical protein